MKMGALVGLLCATRGQGAEGADGVSRDAYLRHLGSCPETELRKRLDFKFESNDTLGAQEIVERREVYSRIKYGGLDGYFAIAGMVLTDGIWHRRYVEVFERSALDIERDEEMIRELMNEMATGEIWREVSGKLAEGVAKRLKEECDDTRRANNEDVRPSTVADHIASKIEEHLRPVGRRWGRVLRALLKRDGVIAGIVEGKYNEELRRMMKKDEELRDVFYGCVLRNQSVMDDILDKNEALAGEIVLDAVEQGYWIYVIELEGAMQTERVRKLILEDDAFARVRARDGLEGEGLSMERLRELAKDEGRLKELIKGAVARLVRSGGVDGLKWLAGAVERRVFDGLVSKEELDALMKEGVGELLRCGNTDELEVLIEALGRAVLDGMFSTGELNTLLREGAEELIRYGEIDKLNWLIMVVNGGFDRLVSRGELDMALREGIERLIRYGAVNELWMLLKIRTVKRRVSGGLVSIGELDAVFKEMVKSIFGDRGGDEDEVYDLKEAMEGGVFDGLVSRKELGVASRKVMIWRAKDLCTVV